MNMKEIKELVKMMNDNDLLELEVEDGDQKVRLRKLYEGMRQQQILAMPAAPMMATAAGAPAAAGAELAAAAPAANERRMKASMVGTFYRAPSPELPPYVDLGDVVKKGAVLCLVEAMKVMNEIKADCDGTIKEILVGNGKAVEYGQEMFVITLD